MKVTALAPWFGSKRILAPEIVRQLGPHRAYWEPFCGSMAVLLAKPACSFETVNDLHEDLTNLAWVVAHERWGPWLYRRLRRTLFAETTFAVAGRDLESLPLADSPNTIHEPSARRAYCWFVLCWMGRSGVIGTAGGNNVFTIRWTPSGGNQATRFAAAVESIPAWRQRLRKVTILRRDGFALIERITDEPGIAVYCDPPYLTVTRSVNGSARYLFDFEEADHERLAVLLRRFRKTRVVVSYYDDPQLGDLYPGWLKLDRSRNKHLATQARRGSIAVTAPEVLLVNVPLTQTTLFS